MDNYSRIDFTKRLKRVDELMWVWGIDRSVLDDKQVRAYYDLGLSPARAFDAMKRRIEIQRDGEGAARPTRAAVYRRLRDSIHN